jgi:hypothetical protein
MKILKINLVSYLDFYIAESLISHAELIECHTLTGFIHHFPVFLTRGGSCGSG